MTPATIAALAAAGVGTASLATLGAYTITSHGKNELTLEAARNLLYCRKYIDKATVAINGTLNSAYRSPEVNKAVGGSPTSDHMRGLAADIKPGKLYTVDSAIERIRNLVALGELGAVRQVINEPGWVHVGWYPPGGSGKLTVLKKVGDDFVAVV